MYTSSIKKFIPTIKMSSYLCKQLTYILKIYALRKKNILYPQQKCTKVALAQHFTEITAKIVRHDYHIVLL